MKTQYIAILFTILCINLYFVNATQNKTKPVQYLLALEQCPSNVKADTYTIHGLWPNYDHKHWPQFCNTTRKFNMNRLTALLPQINKYWQTCKIYNNTEKWFLQHEWLKHGTCMPGDLTEAQYFGTTLLLYHMIDWRNICPQKSPNCYVQVGGTYYGDK